MLTSPIWLSIWLLYFSLSGDCVIWVVCHLWLFIWEFGLWKFIIFHKDDYNYRAVGASGAVTGVLYSAILQPDMMLGIFYNSYASLSLESSICCILFTEWELRMITLGILLIWRCNRWLCNLDINPHLVVDHTFMVILLTIPIIILLWWQNKIIVA
jgi:hypothetical protein